MFIFFLMPLEVLGLGGVLLGMHCAGLGIGLFLLGMEGPSLVWPPYFLLSNLSS